MEEIGLLFQLIININILKVFGYTGKEMYYTFSTDRCAHASIHGCNSVFSYVYIIICNILPLTQQYHSTLTLVVLDLYVSQSTLPCLILFLGI